MKDQTFFIYEIDFQLYPDEDISLESIKLFQDNVEGYYWTLSQEGEICRARFKNIPKKSVVVNTRDEQTRWSLNLLPRFFSKKLSRDEKKVWQIEVYDHHHDETDRIILVDDKIHLELFYRAWQGHLATFKELISDIEKEQKLIE